jgi:hypothetical protein
MPWNLNGNAINPANTYLGTRNAEPLIIRTQNGETAPNPAAEVMRFTPSSGPAGSAFRRVGIRTPNPLFQLHVTAPGSFGGEDVNGVAQAGNVPIVAQSDSTAFGILNSNGRPAFALNIDGNQGTRNARGVPTLYDRFDGNWHPCLSLKNGQVGIGTTPIGTAKLAVDGPVVATAQNTTAILGEGSPGVRGIGISSNLAGVLGRNSSGGNGVAGTSDHANGVLGASFTQSASGVYGENMSQGGFGVAGRSNASERDPSRAGWGAGVLGDNTAGGWAGFFNGDIRVVGTLFKGGGGFSIDCPGDEENRVLNHSFVESPDMMNVYNGNVITDGEGNATVQLPGYFEALNRDFRYQLTAIGDFAQAIVAEEVTDNSFKIKTEKPNVRVSWQVSGIRQDAWANAHRIEVEVEKSEGERGKYLHATEHDQPAVASMYYLEWPASQDTQADINQQQGEI